MIRKSLLFILAFVLFGTPREAFGQTPGEGRAPAYFSLNTGFNMAENAFTGTWHPRPAVHLNMQFPFYGSYIEFGSRYIRFRGDAPTTTDSDFHSLFFYLGWSHPVRIGNRYELSPIIRFGNNLMIFDEPEVFEKGSFRFQTDPTEMEFAYEVGLLNRVKLNERWSIHAGISYNRTLTHFPLPLTMISAGISYAFPQPPWLNHFLR